MKTAKQSIDLEYKGTKKRLNLRTALISLCMFAFVGTSAQTGTVTVKLRNASVKELFSAIEKQTSYRFSYRDAEIKGKGNVTISATNRELKQLLEGELSKLGLKYAVTGNKIIVTPVAAATSVQPKKVTGKVVDANGEPVIGATIKEQGTANGTITDFDGNFTLDVADNAMLEVSYIGYKSQELKAVAGKTLSVTLREDTEVLDEVVVIGYGSMKKGEITSAISSIKSDDFVKGSVRNPAQLLQGKVAGLQIANTTGDPTSGIAMTIRGTTSILGSTDPLVIIDGVPGELSSIAPDDIESIDVLKDGSAAAIYGTRGSNGVIIVTTKSAAAGRTTLEYDGYFTLETIKKKIDVLTADDYIRLSKDPELSSSIDNQGSKTDWVDEITRPAFTQVHNLSLKGGAKSSNYIASVNYRKQQGIIINSGKESLTVKLGLNHSMLDDKLKFQLALYDNYVKTEGIWHNVYLQALLQNPTRPVYNKDGSYTEYGVSYKPYNPVALAKEENAQTSFNRFKANGKIILSPVSGLNLSALASIERYDNMANKWNTFKHYTTTVNSENAHVWNNSDLAIDKMLELLADYNKSIGGHTFSALLGYSYQDRIVQGLSQWAKNFPTDVFGAWNIGASLDIKQGKATMGSYKESNKLISFFSRVTYNYNDKYMFMASVRREGSSRFGINNKWGTFPAVSVGWRIKNEEFLSDVDFINDLKLRVGYGVTGTEVGSNYLSLVLLKYSSMGYMNGNWMPGVEPANNPNPDLKWETKKETNVGLDFALYKRKISGSIDFYRRITSDLLANYSVPVPPNYTSTMLANVGKIRNQGIELVLNAELLQTKNVNLSVSGNFSYNSNKIQALSNDRYQKDYWYEGWTGSPIQQNTHIVQEGGPIGDFYGWKCVGLTNDGLWMVEGADGKPKLASEAGQEDKKIIGNGIPTTFAGLNINLGVKNFDFSVSLRGAFNFEILNQYRMHWETTKRLSEANLPSSALEKPFGSTSYVKESPMYHSYYVEDGDYVKVDNVSLGYTFKEPCKYINRIRVYLTGLNLFTFTKYKGLDPEVSMKGLAPGIEGSDGGQLYPTTRSFTAGVSITL